MPHTETLAARLARNPLRLALAFAVMGAVFLALDAVWLTLMAQRLYRPAIGHLMREGFDVAAAGIFYVLYIAGVTLLAVLPAQRLRGAWARGALFGLVAYGTYDLTNQATLQDWPWQVTLIDLAWGAWVTSTSAAAAYFAAAPRSGEAVP